MQIDGDRRGDNEAEEGEQQQTRVVTGNRDKEEDRGRLREGRGGRKKVTDRDDIPNELQQIAGLNVQERGAITRAVPLLENEAIHENFCHRGA